MFEVVLNFRDENMPQMRKKEDTEAAAMLTLKSWLNRFAGVKSAWLNDEAKRERHVFTPAAYLFTVPIL